MAADRLALPGFPTFEGQLDNVMSARSRAAKGCARSTTRAQPPWPTRSSFSQRPTAVSKRWPGGTDLLVGLRNGTIRPRAVVDLKHIRELAPVIRADEEGTSIGANAVLAQLTANEGVRRDFPPWSNRLRWSARFRFDIAPLSRGTSAMRPRPPTRCRRCSRTVQTS